MHVLCREYPTLMPVWRFLLVLPSNDTPCLCVPFPKNNIPVCTKTPDFTKVLGPFQAGRHNKIFLKFPTKHLSWICSAYLGSSACFCSSSTQPSWLCSRNRILPSSADNPTNFRHSIRTRDTSALSDIVWSPLRILIPRIPEDRELHRGLRVVARVSVCTGHCRVRTSCYTWTTHSQCPIDNPQGTAQRNLPPAQVSPDPRNTSH